MFHIRFLVLVLVTTGNACAATILVLGDSLSAAHNLPVAQGWVSLLERQLKLANCESNVVNASISGETSSGGLTRLPKLLARHHPSIVMLELGANDGLRGLSLDELKRNLATMAGLVRQTGAETLLLGIRLPSNYGRRYTAALASVYSDLASELSLPSVPFLLQGIAEDSSLFQADGLHPSAAAQAKILANVMPYLQPMVPCLGSDNSQQSGLLSSGARDR